MDIDDYDGNVYLQERIDETGNDMSDELQDNVEVNGARGKRRSKMRVFFLFALEMRHHAADQGPSQCFVHRLYKRVRSGVAEAPWFVAPGSPPT